MAMLYSRVAPRKDNNNICSLKLGTAGDEKISELIKVSNLIFSSSDVSVSESDLGLSANKKLTDGLSPEPSHRFGMGSDTESQV